MVILESGLPGSKELQFNAIKQGFEGRNRYAKGQRGLKEAIRNRKRIMAETAIKIIQTSGINPYKQVEMYDNFHPNIPERWRDITCPKPSEEALKMVKAEKEMRAEIKKLKTCQKKEILKRRRGLDEEDCLEE
jgi:hypothetical protein